jgi:hypothetical protein
VTDDSTAPEFDGHYVDGVTLAVIVNQPPLANAGGPYLVIAGQGLTLDGSGSTDPNAAQGDAITNYEWDVDNNGTFEQTGVSPVLTWAQLQALGFGPSGVYVTRLRVTDSFGDTHIATVQVTVRTAQEHWRFTYFGTTANTGDAADTADPDGDGHDNAFEFVAGLVPNDPASRFLLRIEPVAGEPGQKAIIFRPRLTDRGYVLEYKLSLTDAVWLTVPNITTSDDGDERTVIDLDASGGARFYQMEISKP